MNFIPKKTIELFSVDYSDEDVELINKSSAKVYSFGANENWENIGVIKEVDKVSFIYAQNSYETSSAKIEPISFEQKIWDSIRVVANEKTRINNGKLLYINVKVVSPKRKILKISFEPKNKLFSLSYDKNEVDEQGKKIKVEDANRSIFNSIINDLPITETTRKTIQTSVVQGKNTVITAKTLDNLSFLSSDDILVVPTVQAINLENSQTSEHSERITSEMYNQKGSEIEKAARKEYENYKTLKQFFIHNPKHDTKNNQIRKIETTETNTERLSFHAYVVVIREVGKFEKPITTQEGNLKNKVLDLLSVDFDYDNNEMTIRNSNYSGESQDAIIQKLLELSK